jgi:hypothetical protein
MGIPGALIPAMVRSVHAVSAVLLVGGLVFARLGLAPVAAPDVVGRALLRYRPLMIVAILALLASGVYNAAFMGGRSVAYHILFGIKLLLALHVFAAALLAARPKADPGRRIRQLTGILVSGLAVVALGVVLRYV